MSTQVIKGHLSVPKAALQLAFCYSIGFGTIKDDKQATFVLRDHSLKNSDLQNQTQLIANGMQKASNKGELFSILERQGTVQYIDLPQYYRENGLLERAEVNYKLEIRSIQIVFGQSHILCSLSKANLASIYKSQGRWKEAEELEVAEMETTKRVLGQEHPDTLTSIANLASTYRDQGRWKEAAELELGVLEARKRVLGRRTSFNADQHGQPGIDIPESGAMDGSREGRQ
ncbi:MAG: hypothetical protein Q9196_002717 [Gyalolechia fulgens]